MSQRSRFQRILERIDMMTDQLLSSKHNLGLHGKQDFYPVLHTTGTIAADFVYLELSLSIFINTSFRLISTIE